MKTCNFCGCIDHSPECPCVAAKPAAAKAAYRIGSWVARSKVPSYFEDLKLKPELISFFDQGLNFSENWG